jgi:hypothetical protein
MLFPGPFTALSVLANLGTFHEFEVAVTRFFEERNRERLAAPAARETYTTFSEVEHLNELVFVCLLSAVDDKAKCTYLLEAGAHMGLMSAHGMRPVLAAAVQSGKPALVRLLLDHDAVMGSFGLWGQHPLVCLAAKWPERTAALSMLKHLNDYGADLHVEDEAGLTPFELAVMKDDHAMVRFIAEVGGANNLATVVSRVPNNCTQMPGPCDRHTCNAAMVATLLGVGAKVCCVRTYGEPPTGFDGVVLMCPTAHRDLDYLLRQRFQETRAVLMMALLGKQTGEEGSDHVGVLGNEMGAKIYKQAFCDRKRHPLVIKDGVLVPRECSPHLCGRQVLHPNYPFAVLTVPPTEYVFTDPHVEDDDARLPTEEELAKARLIAKDIAENNALFAASGEGAAFADP